MRSKQMSEQCKLRCDAIRPQWKISSELGRSSIRGRTGRFGAAILGEVESDDERSMPFTFDEAPLAHFFDNCVNMGINRSSSHRSII